MPTELTILQEAHSDLEWMQTNAKDILDKYEAQFVAVQGKRIITFAPNVDLLMDKLKRMNVDANMVLVQYIYPRNQIIIF